MNNKNQGFDFGKITQVLNEIGALLDNHDLTVAEVDYLLVYLQDVQMRTKMNTVLLQMFPDQEYKPTDEDWRD